MIAEVSSEKIIAKPAHEPECSTNSAGNKATTLYATAPDEQSTPSRFQQPDHITA